MPIINAGDKEFHLSHEEEDKLNQFKGITDFPEEDLELIIKLLQNHSWHLEPAISRFFDDNWKESLSQLSSANTTGSRPNVDEMELPTGRSPSPPTRVPTPGPRFDRNDGLRVRHSLMDQWQASRSLVPVLPLVKRLPIDYRDKFKVVGLNHGSGTSAQVNGDWNPVMLLLMVIPRFLWKLVTVLFSLITFGLLDDSNQSNGERNRVMMHVPKLPTEEDDNIVLERIWNTEDKEPKMIDRANEWLKGPHISFNDALQLCEDEFKFLLVILVGSMPNSKSSTRDENDELKESIGTINDQEDIDTNSLKLLNKFFTHEKVLDTLDKHKDNMIIYFGSVTELEPWLVARNLNIKYTPECLLIGNVLNGNGSLNGTTRLSVLSRLRITSTRKFQNSLKVTLDKFESELVVSRTEKEELRMAREIKQLQEKAYEDSLRKDRIKEENRRIDADKKALQDRLRLEKEQQIKLNDTISNLKWLKLCVDALDRETGEKLSTDSTNEYATLQIRTSNGARIVKKFKSETTLHSVYCKIGCYLYLNQNSSEPIKWSQSIIDKVKELVDDSSVLCFKDKLTIDDELDAMYLKGVIADELEKWMALTDNEFPLMFDFELVSPFPRCEIPHSEHTMIKEVSQIWPNGSLLVEDIIESDSNEGEEYDDDQ
ncbi:similar to Saccharomyces cerevisiae YML013W UBX2 Protein involved in ER-associated protein degradation [Maudiozyma saulgeensis]|uniref:Similar to Saccharomyces cerevisiae YML013W UBX2 Protein involved in ER-associated protein degradation n=1 Tax=Maudiozyma saulgeensis TaxID=1789683 RepID=A0A1X7QX75_9SACH|nr:similar to Saccharomyces cerevisiae YML013W UBX2 Protein involved in ER-associated protein degradation [Kazachstania saulgeensis]